MWSFAGILFSVLFGLLSYRRPRWAVAAVVFGLPSYLLRFDIFGLPITLLELMILGLFVGWAAKAAVRRENSLKVTPFRWLSLAFIVAAGVSVVVSPDKRAALGIFKAYFVEPAMFFIVFIDTFRDRKPDIIFRALGLSAFLVSGYAVLQKFTGGGIANPFWQNEATRRVTGFFEYPNALGLYLAPIAILLLGYAPLKLKKLKEVISMFGDPTSKHRVFGIVVEGLAFVVVAALSALACVFARSEGAIAGMLAGGVLLAVLHMFYRKKSAFGRVAPFALMAGLSILLALPFLGMKFVDQYEVPEFETGAVRYVYEKATFKDLSGEIRKQGWREVWDMLRDNPVFGAGLVGFQEKIKPYHQDGIFYNFDKDPDFRRKIVIYSDDYRDKHWQPVEIYLYPHHLVLNFWSETGLFGLAVFLIIIGKFFIVSFRRKRFAALCAMTAILVHGIADVPYFKNDLAVLFWLIVGLAAIEKNRSVACR